MNNYHQKQKDKNSFKSSIKRFNTLLEVDLTVHSGYFYINPFSYKTGHKIDKSEQLDTLRGTIVLDYSGGNLCGIELVEIEKHLDLKNLGIQDNGPQINRGEIDGNK